MLLEKLDYLSQGAELVVFAGSLPRDVEDDFYAEAIHDLAPPQVPAALDCEGEPLRLGVEAEPFLVSPNQREAEALVGQEFHDDEDFAARRSTRSPSSAPATSSSRPRAAASRCSARTASPRRYRVVAPRVEPVSTVGSGDTLLGGFLAARSPAGARGRAARRRRGRRGLDARARRRPLRPAPGARLQARRRGHPSCARRPTV